MTPPTVLLDLSFLDALAHPDGGDHQVACDCYARLLDQYQAGKIRLRARGDHLADVPRDQHTELLAPVETIHVARQYRRQAARLHQDYSPDLAVTLVVMRRESIDRIATFDPFFTTIDVTIEVPGDPVAGHATDRAADRAADHAAGKLGRDDPAPD